MNDPIRIAHVVEATAGGVARHLLDLVSHLDPAACTCLFYLSYARPESWRAPFEALRAQGHILREVPLARVPNRRAVAQLAGWAREDRVDLLHLHSARAGYLGRLAAVAAGVPAIYTPHAFPFQRTTDALRPLYRLIERQLAARTAKIICVSHGERDEALRAGLPAEKLIVIPNGLDLARWTPPTPSMRREAREAMGFRDDEIVVGAMARLVSQKGIDLLIQAGEDLLPDYPQLRIAIWGDGPQRRMLRAMARRFHLRALFAGETADPAAAYAAMDVFCAPSRWEGGPYAVLEAMACGLPVVASNIPGHTEVISEGDNGVLFESDLPGPLAGALRIVLADSDVRDALGAGGYRRVQGYAVERMASATLEVYREVAARTIAPVPIAE